MTPIELDELIACRESEILEFKEACNSFSRTERDDYCAAIANEGGGYLIFGVNDDYEIVGTRIYDGNLDSIANQIFEAIAHKVSAFEVLHPKGRVVVIQIDVHPPGRPVRGRNYGIPMRTGSSLREMDAETLRKIRDEANEDRTSAIAVGADLSWLDDAAINLFMQYRAKKLSVDVASLDLDQVLKDIGLITADGKLTIACVLLLGKLQREMFNDAQEMVFEWRQEEGKIEYDHRKEWRGPLLLAVEGAWQELNARNSRFPFHEGFVQRDIYAFDEKTIREAILNAVAHRDYTRTGAFIFIRATPENLVVQSPGGFVKGVNKDNILERCERRNPLVASALQCLGLVERSGQGVDIISDRNIRAGKGLPSYEGSDDSAVILAIPASVKDPSFVKFIETYINERKIPLNIDELIELERLRVSGSLKELRFKEKFLQHGLIEPIGNTSGRKFVLPRRYYEAVGDTGHGLRISGLERSKVKELLYTHIERHGSLRVSEAVDSFPEYKYQDVRNMLQELKRDGRIAFEGSRNKGSWKLTNRS